MHGKFIREEYMNYLTEIFLYNVKQGCNCAKFFIGFHSTVKWRRAGAVQAKFVINRIITYDILSQVTIYKHGNSSKLKLYQI